jgi:hypothetical protein
MHAADLWTWIGPDLLSELVVSIGAAALLWAKKKNPDSGIPAWDPARLSP